MFLEARATTHIQLSEKSGKPRMLNVAEVAVQALEHVDKNFSPQFKVKDGRVTWKRKNKDFHVLLQVKQIIDSDLSDTEFKARIPKIEKILLKTKIFKRLHNRKIQVTKAHLGTTPFEHTVNTAYEGKTDGIYELLQLKRGEDVDSKSLKDESKMMVRAIRWAYFFHDTGKIFGAKHETKGHFHSQLSVDMFWEFFYTYCPEFDDELIQQLLFAVQFHHTSEGFSEKPEERWLEEDEVRNRLRYWKATVLFCILTRADVLSVKGYQHYTESLNKLVKKFNPEVYWLLISSGLLQTVLGKPDAEGDEANGQHAEPAKALAQPQH